MYPGKHVGLERRLSRRGRSRQRLLGRSGWRHHRRRLFLARAGFRLGREGAAQHQSRADSLEHRKSLVQRHHGQQHGERDLQLDDGSAADGAHQLVGLVIAKAADDKMHDALSGQPGRSRGWENQDLVQITKGGRHQQEGQAADQHSQCHALQHAGRHRPLRIVTLLSENVNAPRAA